MGFDQGPHDGERILHKLTIHVKEVAPIAPCVARVIKDERRTPASCQGPDHDSSHFRSGILEQALRCPWSIRSDVPFHLRGYGGSLC